MIIVTPPSEPTVPTEPLSASVSASLTPTDKARVAAAAASSGLSVSALVRAAILAYLREGL